MSTCFNSERGIPSASSPPPSRPTVSSAATPFRRRVRLERTRDACDARFGVTVFVLGNEIRGIKIKKEKEGANKTFKILKFKKRLTNKSI
jgi:hypothetical protein